MQPNRATASSSENLFQASATILTPSNSNNRQSRILLMDNNDKLITVPQSNCDSNSSITAAETALLQSILTTPETIHYACRVVSVVKPKSLQILSDALTDYLVLCTCQEEAR